MKKILVPVDFSGYSQNALNYAIGLARDMGAALHLLHTYVVHASADMIISIERYIREDAEKMMEDSRLWIHKQWPDHPPVTYDILKGNAIPLIASLADQYDLVVMGTQGASKFKDIFLGSTTNGVCKATETPVLAIPGNARYRPIKKIVMAVDDYEVTGKNVVEPLIEFAELNDADIKIFHTELGQADLGVDPIIGMYLSGQEYSFHYAPATLKINESIHDFVLTEKADMLCMIGRKRARINELFHRSVTKREVFQTEVPLLILTDVAVITDF
jgi:nucleotide-binding universal stress UspA family protein